MIAKRIADALIPPQVMQIASDRWSITLENCNTNSCIEFSSLFQRAKVENLKNFSGKTYVSKGRKNSLLHTNMIMK